MIYTIAESNRLGLDCHLCGAIKTDPKDKRLWKIKMRMQGSVAYHTGDYACPDCVPDSWPLETSHEDVGRDAPVSENE